jgi:hypothetical protein
MPSEGPHRTLHTNTRSVNSTVTVKEEIKSFLETEGVTRGDEETFGVMEMFVILTLVMVSWVKTNGSLNFLQLYSNKEKLREK